MDFTVQEAFGMKEQHTFHFVTSAICFWDSTHNKWINKTGRRHHEIIKNIHDEGYSNDYKKNHIDGFMYFLDNDYTLRFMDRNTATQIAKIAGFKMIGCVLTSEDLW